MSVAKEQREKLIWEFPNIGKKAPEQEEKAFAYCEGYKEFLNAAKTEREFVREAVLRLKEAGYEEFEEGKIYQPGDKVYQINRKKALLMSTFGKRPLEDGVRINVAHIDSPRLDLKPNPLYEKAEAAHFKTHYYGGIKGEELNIIVGSLPYPCEEEDSIKEPVKLLALSLLNERFGMTEKDFLRAEIEFVPAVKATDVGLDRSLVGAYGQDDKVCAYTALTAEMKAKSPEYTTVTILADKEEIGSVGNTGLNSDFTLHYIEGLCKAGNVDVRKVLRHSLCLSADVNAAYDPTFASVFEEKNSCYLNKGVVLTKYTGARGKSGSNDASAETMAKVIQIMDEAGVYWQIGELGAVDVGGGGTVALFVAGMDVDVVDMGVPILSMHAPFELASKLDIYNTYLAFAAFCS
ncbi:aminopeptidase [uncultured Clostridium sp.]|uniref:aminopeptidase n=1 Tax=uncultured Clostridium sp. TaxID=59620 RepID=UPI0025990CA9|nr:aminopeptidase [uncultured Clostridium sp.]